jgi:hypothetical protein
MKNTVTERRLRFGRAPGGRERGNVLTSRIRVYALGWRRSRRGRRLTLRRGDGGQRRVRAALIGHAPDPSAPAIPDVEGPVRTFGEPGRSATQPDPALDGAGQTLTERSTRLLSQAESLRHRVWCGSAHANDAFHVVESANYSGRLDLSSCTYCLVSDRRSAALNWEGVVPFHVRKAR